MNRFFALSVTAILSGAGLLAGCDTPAAPIKDSGGNVVKFVTVQADDPVEVAAVKSAEAARAEYHYRLGVLKDYYFKMGNAEKLSEAENELNELDNAQYFRFQGVEAIQPPGVTVTDADERLLVEECVAARNEWFGSMKRLAEYYHSKNDSLKARLVENALARMRPERMYTYLDTDIPGPELRPTDSVPQADEIYARAYKLYQDGKGITHTLLTADYTKESQALVLFKQLVHDYPRSTKIALSAYYIGEIYKEYYNDYSRAVRWYERSFQWDSHITEPARFQAAVIYDSKLKNPGKAVQLYRASLDPVNGDPWRYGNREYAQDRIDALTPKKK